VSHDWRHWRRALVYGLGVSGRAASALLRRHGVEVVAVDARGAEELALGELAADAGVDLRLGGEPETLPAGIDGVVLSPGVPPDRPLLVDAGARGVAVIAEVELAFPLLQGPVVGITGSNGKSTTTALTGALLEHAGFVVEVCGNIGRPLSAVAEGAPGRIFVVELSSFQLEAIRAFRPAAAALLNLSPDHLDRYPDLAGYRRAKERIFMNQGRGDVAVLRGEDPALAGVAVTAHRRCFTLSAPVADGCWLDGETVVESTPGAPPRALFERGDLAIPGPQNLENAMAAALLALAVGAPAATLAPAMRSFRGLPHRTQVVATVRGVLYVDDSKGTNTGATARALAGYPDRAVHLILGGRSKQAPLGELLEVMEAKVRRAYLIGEAAEELRGQIDGRVEWRSCGALERAVAEAAVAARSGEVVLLSPACASFDQYGSYAERGDHFQRLVHGLEGS
jgi:UDP-N-acetylmuramoylalanine--D-glutamate ligase